MKITLKVLAGLLIMLVLQTNIVFSQETKEEAQQPPVIVVTTAHADFDYKEGTYKDWLELEKEYFEKVTSKNEYLMNTNVLTHYYTEDNSEVKFVRVCKDWNDIENSSDNIKGLIETHWPDEEKRKEFFKKYGQYFTGWHADYIYQNIPELMK